MRSRETRTRPAWRELSTSEKQERLDLLRNRQQQQVELEVLWLRK
jgi:hypothetical protein